MKVDFYKHNLEKIDEQACCDVLSSTFLTTGAIVNEFEDKFSTLGENNLLGIGSIVIDNLTIHDNIRTGGGAVVVNNLSEPGLYVGCPAKKQSR